MSCLFDSLALCLKNNMSSLHIRHLICNTMMNEYTSTGNINISNTSLKDWILMENDFNIIKGKRYIQNMYLQSTWGGGLELSVASYLFKVKIYIVKNTKIISIFDITNLTNPTKIFIQYNGFHYTPITCKVICNK